MNRQLNARERVLVIGVLVVIAATALLPARAEVSAQTATPAPTNTPAATGPTPAANLGGPSGVPSARFYGSASQSGVAVSAGEPVIASVGGSVCGSGTTSSGQYFVDVQ